MSEIPGWLGSALTGVVFALLGFLSKSALDWYRQRRQERKNEQHELKSLYYLLNDSRSIFLSQNYQVCRLMDLLREHHESKIDTNAGFDETFHQLFDQMRPQERELHALIRSLTRHSMRRANERLRTWLEKNRHVLHDPHANPERQKLASELRKLAQHLDIWFAKFRVWIPNKPTRSLVYVADEKEHGPAFPRDLHGTLMRLLHQDYSESRETTRPDSELDSWE